MTFYNDLAIPIIIASLLFLIVCLCATAVSSWAFAVLWSASASMASVMILTFFSFLYNDFSGNMLAMCIMVFMLCYSAVGASLSIVVDEYDRK
jgi:NADH:ubiquinone oxidoreductase subunit K